MSAKPAPTEAPRPPRLTIGTVCKLLHEEFPDISISKIRFLEDQKLITPRRTPGGYRLYSDDDVGQLREILRMQRDEFLPLRVIRQVIAQGRSTAGSGRRPRLVGGGEDALSLEQLLSDADADARLRARARGVPAPRRAAPGRRDAATRAPTSTS